MLEIENQTIKLDCLKSDISDKQFIQISDFHFTENTSMNKINRLTDKIKKQNPVAIFVTGDLISDRDGVDSVIHFIGKLSKDFPVYIVFGNWEYWVLNNNVNDFQKNLENVGAKVLINSHFDMEIDNKLINIIGIKDPFKSDNPNEDLKKALNNIENKDCNILLAHSPDIIKEASQKNIDLVLVGHTHGGQIYIPFLTEKIVSSNPDGKRFIKGFYQSKETQMYVNRGIGMTALPFRFLNPPEITSINFSNN